MATYGNTGGNGLNINVYSGSGGNLSEWALDFDGLKLLTIPEIITASNITTNQSVTVTLKAKPIFNNISVSFFRVKLPDGSIAEYPAINNTAIFTTPIAGALGSQQTLLVYARDNSGNRSAVASHLYTVVNSLPPSTSAITHNIPSSFSAGDVKQIQISGAVDPEGDPYTYSLILPPEISGSKISGIANNETVTLTVQNTIDYTKQDNIVIRVTDINGAQDDKVLTVTLLSGGSSGGTNNFNVRTSFPSSVYPNEVFTAKIWELGTNNYTYGLNLPSGVTASKTMGILSNENFTVTIAPNVAPNSTIGIDVVVYTGNVSVGSFVVNMLVDGITGETSYTTPGSYEFTVPNTVNSLSMLEVYSDKITESQLGDGGFVIENLKEENLRRGQKFTSLLFPGNTPMQLNNMILTNGSAGFLYTLDNFTTINTASFPPLHIYTGAYGNGSYIVSGDIASGDETMSTMLSVNNGLSWSPILSASVSNSNRHLSIDFYNSTFYILKNNPTHDNLVSTDGGYNFIIKQLPLPYRNYSVWDGVVCNKDGYLRVMWGDNKVHLLRTIDRCNTWTEIAIPDTTSPSFGFFRCVNDRYILISNISNNMIKVIWSDDLVNWYSSDISLPAAGASPNVAGRFIIWFDKKYIISLNNITVGTNTSLLLNEDMQYINYTSIALQSSHSPEGKIYTLTNDNELLFAHTSVSGGDNVYNKLIFLSSISTDNVNIDNLFSHMGSRLVKFYNCNNEIVCLYPNDTNYGYSSVCIKLTSPVNNTNGAYLTNDLSDKNVVTSQVVPSMSFKAVVSSGNNLIAINRLDYKVYRNTIGSNTWDLIPELNIDQNSDTNNIHVFGNTIIFNSPQSTKMYISTDSGATWATYTTSGYSRSVLYKGKIYSTKLAPGGGSYSIYEFNINNSTETQLSPSPGGLLYVLNNVLIGSSYTDSNASYFDENYLVASNAFKSIADINSNYNNKFPQNLRADMWTLRNYSTKYVIGDYNPDSISIFNQTVKNITLNDIINNQISTINTLTTGVKGVTNGIVPNPGSQLAQLRVYDNYIIFINNFIVSISIDGGGTFTSVNTNAVINDVVVCNDIIYIFSGNTVKKIVPSILDNSNIINKDSGIGYSLVNPKQAGNFGKNGYAKYLNNIEVTPGDKINVDVSSPDGGVRLVWGTNRFFPTNAS